jgi:hypothetical protein
MRLLELNKFQTFRLYHGSLANHDGFDITKVDSTGFARGMGFHFVNDYALATQYADGGVIYVCDITVQNPLIYGEDGSKGPNLDRQRVINLGHDSYMFKERRYIELVIFDTTQIKIIEIQQLSDK